MGPELIAITLGSDGVLIATENGKEQIGGFAVPLSLSLRLFGNVMSGTVLMGLIYDLLSPFTVAYPAVLHAYFDLFSGCIQAYVFCMLTMVYVNDKIAD